MMFWLSIFRVSTLLPGNILNDYNICYQLYYFTKIGYLCESSRDRVVHQRSHTMFSRTLFPGIRTNVVRLLHTENPEISKRGGTDRIVSLVYAVEKVAVRCYVMSDVFIYRRTPFESPFSSSYQRSNNVR